MHLSTVFSIFILATAVLSAGLNTSTEYHLRTQLKPGQESKIRFDNLWLDTYHTGAGLSDAVLLSNQSSAIKGFLKATNTTQSNGQAHNSQEFDLRNTFPWGLVVTDYSSNCGWEPVRINAGTDQDGYFINSNGLQWIQDPSDPASTSSFKGWLVCDWWHGVPQLFSKRSSYHFENPSSCADVNLIPVYI